MNQFDVVLDGRSFLEGSRWRAGRVWVSDCYAGEVLSVRADGTDARVEATVEGQPSGLGFLPDGRLLVASMLDNRIVRREPDGTLVTHADLRALAVGEINDMAVDPSGTCWVGCFGFDLTHGAPYEPAPLVRVAPDGSASVVATGLACPNGTVCDGHLLVVAETFAGRMAAFDVAGDGTLTGRRVWAEFGDEPPGVDALAKLNGVDVAPDGLAEPDAEGAIWVADATHHRALRVGEGGKVLDEVAVDGQVYDVTLGGPDGRTLFLAVSPSYLKSERAHTRDSVLLSLRVDVPLRIVGGTDEC
ncbi:SMP-30/gluconolactonase/LRE family protein [Pseudonocardia sp. CA-107938]|uniref:SMP-30/gluconolactonase/LRE family protein n=1 Tax=Pseudonocardia sp. CA-107938 TaxID=3240021 RepID=UPI003D8C88BD